MKIHPIRCPKLLLLILALETSAAILRVSQPPSQYVAPGKTDGEWRPPYIMERKLSDEPKVSPQKYKVEHKLSKMERQLKFMKVVQGILKNAKKKNLEIQSIKLGANVKKIFHNKNVSKDLNKYVNDKNFDRKLRHLERKVRKLKLKQTQTGKRKAENGSGAMGFAGEGAQGDQFPERQSKLSAAGGGGDMMKFNFLPGFAGMPFPPFMMNGPHFHPPVAVTVNSIPNPNPRSVLNPFEIEQSNLKKQIDELSNVKDSLSMLEAKMNRVDNNIQLSLDDKYNRILQLNN